MQLLYVNHVVLLVVHSQVVVTVSPKVCGHVMEVRVKLPLRLPIDEELVLHFDCFLEGLVFAPLGHGRLIVFQCLLVDLDHASWRLVQAHELSSSVSSRVGDVASLVTHEALLFDCVPGASASTLLP